MENKEIEKRYRKVIRSHPRSGATWQHTKEIDCAPATDSKSPYWEDAKSRRKSQGVELSGAEDIHEHDAASGDNRAFQQKGDIQTLVRNAEYQEETTARVRKLLDLAKQILTTQQYNVFVMLAVKEPHLTERETAKVLGVTPGRVHQLWVKAQVKLQRAYNERT